MIAHAYKAEFVNETLTTTAIEALVNNCKIDQGKNVSTFFVLAVQIPSCRTEFLSREKTEFVSREKIPSKSPVYFAKNGNFARLTVISQSILQFDQ